MQKHKPKMLVIAKTLPLHDRASGDYRLFQILEILSKDIEIHFLSTQHPLINLEEKVVKKNLYYAVRDGNFRAERFDFVDERYAEDLRKIGVKPLNQVKPVPLTMRPTNDYDIRPYLAKETYDIVWVEFFYVADQYMSQIRQYQPWAKVIVDSVDLHFRRLARQAHYLENEVKYLVNFRQEKKKPGLGHKQKAQEHRNYSDHVREQELRIYEKADAVVMVSEDDQQELKRHIPKAEVLFVPNIHRKLPKKPTSEVPTFESRNGVVFVGNFDHNPNVTSAIFLKHEIAPAITASMGPIPIYMVGSNPPYVVRTMGKYGPMHENFIVTGYVPETLPYLDKAKVSIAPILFGAGMNGKIGEAIAAGVPVVTTALGALGMGLTHEVNCLVAEKPEEFAYQIKRLHEDRELWYRIRDNAQKYLESTFSRAPMEKALRSQVLGCFNLKEIRKHQPQKKRIDKIALPDIKLPAPKFPSVSGKPDVTVILLAFNEWRVTEFCLRSLAYAQKKNPEIKVEYLLVDNASKDETSTEAKKISGLRVIRNKKNLGFAGGNNVGIKLARGTDVVILNNDTVVAPNWLARFRNHLKQIPDVGLIGPSTNTEVGQALPNTAYNSLREFYTYNEELGDKCLGAWDSSQKVSGLCMYIPRNTLNKVGVLDTNYGIGYFEDDDYCLRIRDAGLKLVVAKDLYVHHFGSMSFEGNSMRRDKYLENGMSQFVFKWGKRGLEHVARAHRDTLLRLRKPKTTRAY